MTMAMANALRPSRRSMLVVVDLPAVISVAAESLARHRPTSCRQDARVTRIVRRIPAVRVLRMCWRDADTLSRGIIAHAIHHALKTGREMDWYFAGISLQP